jgi:hypothetical protein
VQNAFVADIIRDVVEPDRAASLLCFFKQAGMSGRCMKPKWTFAVLSNRHLVG